MAKPDLYLPRFTVAGDTIPPSRLPGRGGATHRTYYETGDSTEGPNPPLAGWAYDVGTRFIGLQEQETTGKANRAHWWFANAIDFVAEGEVAPPQYTPAIGSVGDADTQVGDLVYLGETGDNEITLNERVGIVGDNFHQLFETPAPPTLGHVVATDLRTQGGGGGQSMYPGFPGGALNAINAVAGLVAAGTAGANLEIQAGPAFVAGDSLWNYSLWLRHVRDNLPGNLSDAFATVEVVIGADDYTVHRIIEAAAPATDWLENDEIYITHYAYAPWVVFNTTISVGVNYRVIYGEHATVGRLGRETNVTGRLFHPKATTKSLNKLIPLALAQPDSATGWQYSSTGGTQWMNVVAAGGAPELITVPVIVPHGAILKNVTMREMNSIAMSNDGSIELYKEPYTGARTLLGGLTTTFDNFPAAGDVTLGPVNEVVDLETNEYYIEISSGFDAANPVTVTIYAIKISFDYEDIRDHIE